MARVRTPGSPEEVGRTVAKWMAEGRDKLRERAEAARRIAVPDAAYVVADEIMQQAQTRAHSHPTTQSATNLGQPATPPDSRSSTRGEREPLVHAPHAKSSALRFVLNRGLANRRKLAGDDFDHRPLLCPAVKLFGLALLRHHTTEGVGCQLYFR
ncbi:MAG UNVERIFIED_CONTAM: hypothetical protein LVT10_23435 [Anaerolineae bacterium]